MKTRFPKSLTRLTALLFALSILTLNGIAQQRLVVVGGGKRPPDAIKKFVEWAGGEKARILIITWASGVPVENFAGLKADFSTVPTASIEHAPIAPLDAEKKSEFLLQLKTATGVFFSGGDQNRIMDVLKDTELLKLLRERYNTGIVFGGTSAGAAIMSDPMMTGEADLQVLDGSKVGRREGLGLLSNVIVDQHFIIRQRENRLFGLVLDNPAKLGIGIDEDTAILVKDNRSVEIVGSTQVMFISCKKRNSAMIVYVLKAGDKFDLKNRKPR